MEMLKKYMPQEYLALKINYCREQLEKLPVVKVQTHTVNGIPTRKLIVGNHKFKEESNKGREYLDLLNKRNELENELAFLMAVWNLRYLEKPNTECIPHKARRILCVDAYNRVVMDKDFFDSLENNADARHPKPNSYPFNGIYYRSAAERDIAMFYTDAGIPFKYEPAITISGITGVINPDFVIYIRELDTCKIHEHFGVKNSASYLRIVKIKYEDYTDAGLIPDTDILFTYDTEDMPFDIRMLTHKLNNAVYSTAVGTLPAS